MRRHRTIHVLAGVIAFACGLSLVIGGLGNVGRPGGGAGGTLDVELNPHFSVMITPGRSLADVRDELVMKINADPNFQAAAVTDPNDPTALSFQVLTASGGEVDRLNIFESDPNIDNVGFSFAAGKQAAVLSRVTQVNADPNGNYRLMIDVWDGTDYDQTFLTDSAPNNTAAGLNASIQASLTAAGFTTYQSGENLVIEKPGTMIVAVRPSATDSGVVQFRLEATSTPPGAIPTVSQVGMFVLVLLLTGAAILVLRRRAAAVS